MYQSYRRKISRIQGANAIGFAICKATWTHPCHGKPNTPTGLFPAGFQTSSLREIWRSFETRNYIQYSRLPYVIGVNSLLFFLRAPYFCQVFWIGKDNGELGPWAPIRSYKTADAQEGNVTKWWN